ncbi:Uncharacterized protein M6B38_220915 [Iris pallida]|uniref:VOC domain-containing protein n=1 Tax=Iris pallida TaxID=29817 RepID=A0AAX6DYK4_IRIPA|nr:Uncharacterized protein M6B38_220915 [Iris pallida]
MAVAAAQGVRLHHISRETSDLNRLGTFYQEILVFERIESPKFPDFEVVWLKLDHIYLHLIERNPQSKLPEGPFSAPEGCDSVDPKAISRGHHLCFGVSNFDSFVQKLKEKGVRTFETTRPDGKTKQVFFFDPDGNGLEVASC